MVIGRKKAGQVKKDHGNKIQKRQGSLSEGYFLSEGQEGVIEND